MGKDKKKLKLSKTFAGFIAVDAVMEIEEALFKLTEALPKDATLRAAQLRFKLPEAEVEFIQLAGNWWVKIHNKDWHEEEVNYG